MKEINRRNEMITDSMRKFFKERWEEFSESLTDDLGPKQDEDASDEQKDDSEFKVLVEERVVSYTYLSHSNPMCYELDDLSSADE
eukprot:Awhi_evm1s107